MHLAGPMQRDHTLAELRERGAQPRRVERPGGAERVGHRGPRDVRVAARDLGVLGGCVRRAVSEITGVHRGPHPVEEAHAHDQLHGEEPLSLQIEQFVQLNQIAVLIQPGQRSKFTFEPQQTVGRRLLQHLDGHHAVPLPIVGFVDDAVRAGTNDSLNRVSRPVAEDRMT